MRDELPTVEDALASLGDASRLGAIVIVEETQTDRARLSLTVDTGGELEGLLYGARGWTRVPGPTVFGVARRARPGPAVRSTYWRWVRP